MKRILIVFTLIVFLLSLSIVKADTNLTSCQRLNTNGETYYLINDILNSSGSNCFWTYINNNNVLDCLGHAINGSGSYYGIDFSESYNNTVKNCFITNFNYGIFIYYSYNNTISNNSLSFNSYGLGLGTNSHNNLITNNIIFNNSVQGLRISSGYDNTIRNNVFKENLDVQIYLSSVAYNNTIYNNLFNATSLFYIDSTPFNYWNTTKQLGVKIYGIGNVIGGNYWTNSTKNGFSDICNDTDIDWICDDNFTLKTNNIDYLPLTTFIPLPLNLTNYTYTICSDSNILYNHYYNFVNGIANYSDVKFYCPYGCNNMTYSCELDPIQSGFLGLGIVISFIIILLLIDKWLSKGRK
jgi:parallel beta-helix repeat protein